MDQVQEVFHTDDADALKVRLESEGKKEVVIIDDKDTNRLFVCWKD